MTLLAKEAEAAANIDPEEAKISFDTAKANLEKAKGEKEKVETNFAFKQANARFRVVRISEAEILSSSGVRSKPLRSYPKGGI